MGDVEVWLDREDRVVKLVVDGEHLDPKIRFKVDWNFWVRDTITVYKWNDGWSNADMVTFKGLFQIVFTTA